MVKSPYYDKNGLKKGAWSPEEDEKLKVYVQRYGHWNWRELPKFAGLSRCGKSCRLRWMNYLQPDVKRGNYTREEDEVILKVHEELGNKWSIIASKLPGRTDNEIKNHWHTHLKKRSKQNLTKDEVKEAHELLSEDSHSERNHNRSSDDHSESESVPADYDPSHHILESSVFSEETCSSDFTASSSSPKYDQLSSGVNGAVEDSLGLSETFDQFIGDFWTEPFVADNTFVPNYCPSPLFEGGFTSPYASYHNNGTDLCWDLGF